MVKYYIFLISLLSSAPLFSMESGQVLVHPAASNKHSNKIISIRRQSAKVKDPVPAGQRFTSICHFLSQNDASLYKSAVAELHRLSKEKPETLDAFAAYAKLIDNKSLITLLERYLKAAPFEKIMELILSNGFPYETELNGLFRLYQQNPKTFSSFISDAKKINDAELTTLLAEFKTAKPLEQVVEQHKISFCTLYQNQSILDLSNDPSNKKLLSSITNLISIPGYSDDNDITLKLSHQPLLHDLSALLFIRLKPVEHGNFTRLRSIALDHCRLKEIPTAVRRIKSLRELFVRNNPGIKLKSDDLKLPDDLKEDGNEELKLNELALSGNGFSEANFPLEFLIPVAHTLTMLQLKDNNFRQFSHIAQALKTKSHGRSLRTNLENNPLLGEESDILTGMTPLLFDISRDLSYLFSDPKKTY